MPNLPADWEDVKTGKSALATARALEKLEIGKPPLGGEIANELGCLTDAEYPVIGKSGVVWAVDVEPRNASRTKLILTVTNRTVARLKNGRNRKCVAQWPSLPFRERCGGTASAKADVIDAVFECDV